MENKDYNEKIDTYIAGKMPPEERTTFEQQMKTDVALEQEVKAHVAEREAIKLLLQEDFKQSIAQWRSEGVAEKEEAKVVTMKPARSRSFRRVLTLAASFLVLVVAGLGFFAQSNYSDQALINANYLTADSAGDKSGAEEVNPLIEQGKQAYFNQTDYDAAIGYFNQITTDSQYYVEAQYYLAHAQLQNKNYTPAIQHFNFLLNQPELPAFMNRSKIQWHQLLAKVGNGATLSDVEAELDQFIQDGEPPFNQKAVDLKAQLNSFWRSISF